jgi:hypothetical protein
LALLIKYYSGNEIKKNEIGRSCGRYGGREEVHTGLWWGNLMEKGNLEDQGIGGRTIFK